MRAHTTDTPHSHLRALSLTSFFLSRSSFTAMSDTFPPSAPNHTDRFRRLLSHRSWQLYSALALSTTLAGVGIYWLTHSTKDDHQPPPERPKAPLPSVEEYDSLSDETVARLSPEVTSVKQDSHPHDFLIVSFPAGRSGMKSPID